MSDSKLICEEAEIGVLGCLLFDPGKALDICIDLGVHAGYFYGMRNKLIVEVISEMVGNNESVDALTLSDKLKRIGRLEHAGGVAYLNKLIDDHTTLSHLAYYIDMLKKAQIRRQILDIATEAIDKVKGIDDPEELRADCELKFTKLCREKVGKTLKEIFDEIETDVEKASRGEHVETGILTGFPALDTASGKGLRRGGIYWISGFEGTGKTSFKNNLIEKWLEMGYRVADLTLEMSKRDELERLMSIQGRRSVPWLIRNQAQLIPDRFKASRDLFIDSGNLVVSDQSEVQDTTQLNSWAKRMVGKHKADVICIDYFQLLGLDGENKMNMEQATSMKSAALKRIAGSLNVPVVCVAAINEQGKVRGSRMADYDGAGHWRLETDNPEQRGTFPNYERDVTLVTQKARFGTPFRKIKYLFLGATGKFFEKGGQNDSEDRQGDDGSGGEGDK